MTGNQHIYVSHRTCVKYVTQSKTHPSLKKKVITYMYVLH
jgi:hypothetical protein